MNVLVRRMDKKYIFGFDYVLQGEYYFPYSDIEKTFIDMIHFKERLSDEAVKNIILRIDFKKLNSYLKNYPKRTRKIALGYFQ